MVCASSLALRATLQHHLNLLRSMAAGAFSGWTSPYALSPSASSACMALPSRRIGPPFIGTLCPLFSLLMAARCWLLVTSTASSLRWIASTPPVSRRQPRTPALPALPSCWS